jgi:kumamolisin
MATAHVVLEGSRRLPRPGAEVLGRSDAHEWCEVTIKVRRKAPLPAPSSSGAAVISRARLTELHGASQEDMDKVEKVLTGFGINTVSRNLTTRTLRAAGPSSAMENAFNVHLLRSRHESRVFRSRVGDIYLPQELAGVVVGVFGLDNRRMAKHRAVTATQRKARPLPAANNRAWFLPQELANIYGFPSGDGTGQTIGVIELGGEYVARDLEHFAVSAQLPNTPKVQVVNAETLASADARDSDSTGEVMLDIEVVAGVCPNANIVAYFSNFTEQGWVDVLDAAIHDTTNNPNVISISWGLAEGANIWTQQAMQTINDTLQVAATLGLPVCVAAGDDGSDDQVGDGLAHVDFPSSSPFVLCVGGTTLTRQNGAGTIETVWKEGDGLRADGGGSTGGGVSTVFPRPAFQNVTIASVNPGSIDGRVVPDVAADAAEGTGYFFIANGQEGVAGGTSAATPLWASLIARLNSARGAGRQIGYLTPLLYQPTPQTNGQPLGAVACHDITSGNNNTAAAGGYSAGPGYDAVSGWGSPNGANLLQYLP